MKVKWLTVIDCLIIHKANLISELQDPILDVKISELKNVKRNIVHNLIRKLTISPFIDEDWGDYIDGEIYTLTIGNKSYITIFTWLYLHEKWIELQHFTNTLLNLSADGLENNYNFYEN